MTTASGDQRCLVSIWFGCRNVVVACPQVYRTKPCRTLNSIQTVVNQRKWVAFLSRNSIELSIVDAKSKRSILFPHENNITCPWTCRWFDYAMLFHLSYLFIDHLKVFERMSPERLPNGTMCTGVDSVFNE